jgi:hypothetical protein
MCDIAEAVFNWDLASSPASSESGNMLGVERNSSTQVEVRLGGRRKVERKWRLPLFSTAMQKRPKAGILEPFIVLLYPCIPASYIGNSNILTITRLGETSKPNYPSSVELELHIHYSTDLRQHAPTTTTTTSTQQPTQNPALKQLANSHAFSNKHAFSSQLHRSQTGGLHCESLSTHN